MRAQPVQVDAHALAAGPGSGAGGAVQVATKAPGHEPVAVGVDEVAGHVLAESRRGRARQAEVHGPGAPERDLRPAHHRPDLEPVAGQEPFRGQDAEGVDVVVAFRLPAGSPVRSLEPLHEPVAAAKQRLVVRFERAAALAQGVEAGNLPHRPLQAAPQARHPVVRHGPAIGQVHRHAMAPAGATGALPVVGGQRRRVTHQHRVEPADVDAELRPRGAASSPRAREDSADSPAEPPGRRPSSTS